MQESMKGLPVGEYTEQGASVRVEGYWHATMGDASENVRVIRELKTTPERQRKGDATYLMAQVCVAADDARKILVLDAIPGADSPVDEGTLRAFYMRFGFRPMGEDPSLTTMVREPRGINLVRSQ